MANTYIDDMEALADYLEAEGYATSTALGVIPKTYKQGLATVRLLRSGNTAMNGHYYGQDRTYQVALFDAKPVELLRKVDDLSAGLANMMKLPVNDGYLSLMGNVGFSEVFLTEDERLYAVICVIEATVQRTRPIKEYELVQEIGITVNEENI